MSAHKKIPKKIRLLVYEKCNHRCAYCGCELEYKDMQVDHVKSVFANTDVSHTMTEEEMYSEKNFLPACRQCNFYKSCGNLESFREALTSTLMRNLQKTFQYRLAIKYGLIQEHIEPVQFKIERLQDVTEDGAKAEGAIDNRGFIHSPENEYDRIHTAREHFIKIWNSTIKKSDLDRYGWDANPYV